MRPGKSEDAVNAAEGAFSFHTVKHHNSYRSMDCTSALLKKAFPDSDTAKNCNSARTKTEAIVNVVLAPHSVEVTNEGCDKFCADVQGLYSACLEYLEKWMTPMEEFSTFMWMDMSEPPDWDDVEVCIKYLREKGVPIDDVKCFDQVANLKRFVERCNNDEEFIGLQVHQKWTKYFEKAKSIECYSELLKILIMQMLRGFSQ